MCAGVRRAREGAARGRRLGSGGARRRVASRVRPGRAVGRRVEVRGARARWPLAALGVRVLVGSRGSEGVRGRGRARAVRREWAARGRAVRRWVARGWAVLGWVARGWTVREPTADTPVNARRRIRARVRRAKSAGAVRCPGLSTIACARRRVTVQRIARSRIAGFAISVGRCRVGCASRTSSRAAGSVRSGLRREVSPAAARSEWQARNERRARGSGGRFGILLVVRWLTSGAPGACVPDLERRASRARPSVGTAAS